MDSTAENNGKTEDVNKGAHTQKEIEKLQEIFNTYLEAESDTVTSETVVQILKKLKQDTKEATDIMTELGISPAEIAFEEFFAVLTEIEKRRSQEQGKPTLAMFKEVKAEGDNEKTELVIEIDTKIIDILKYCEILAKKNHRLLEEYREKCVSEGNYNEANKAKQKYDELKRKETIRQVNILKATQENELNAIQEAQKAQFLEFSRAWDNYMQEYEATALKSIDSLKERHAKGIEEGKAKAREELVAKLKFSKMLLEMRKKEKALVKLKKYEEAEAVKDKADELEMKERQKLDQDFGEQLNKREAKIKATQQLAMAALLKRIQRDRNEQVKQRQLDSMRLIQRNKNLLNDILAKHGLEIKKSLECLKQVLGATKSSEVSASTVSRLATFIK